ncbi:DUF6525 family protein [Loktanella salsilacus]|uniref:DUF6525 family protein n=1 Tax=Loktanella salsilacus TaxID=195913 RepID=UPI003735808D
MSGNLGATRLRRRRACADPMRTYDRLPPPLRQWLAQAALPWSPKSCHRIWQRAAARGEPVDSILALLDRSEVRTLEKDRAAHPAARPD